MAHLEQGEKAIVASQASPAGEIEASRSRLGRDTLKNHWSPVILQSRRPVKLAMLSKNEAELFGALLVELTVSVHMRV